MPIQLIWGNDTYACDIEIKKIINKSVSENWKPLNVSILNGEDPNQVIQALEEMQTPPFGEGSRVIVLKNNPIFNKKDEKLFKKFESNSSNIPSSTLLILQNIQKPDSRMKSTKFLNKLINENQAIESSFSLPEIWDLDNQIKYIENAAKDMNIQLDKNCAEAILNSLGTDSAKLKNELKKARLYLEANSNNIYQKKDDVIRLTQNDIKKIFNEHQSNIFKIVDLIIKNKMPESLYEINTLISKGEPPLRLLAGLTSQVRLHTIVLLLGNEKDLTQISKIAGLSNPKRLYFIKKKISTCSPEFLINILIKLLNIESLIKRGNNPMNVFTENLLL